MTDLLKVLEFINTMPNEENLSDVVRFIVDEKLTIRFYFLNVIIFAYEEHRKNSIVLSCNSSNSLPNV